LLICFGLIFVEKLLLVLYIRERKCLGFVKHLGEFNYGLFTNILHSDYTLITNLMH